MVDDQRQFGYLGDGTGVGDETRGGRYEQAVRTGLGRGPGELPGLPERAAGPGVHRDASAHRLDSGTYDRAELLTVQSVELTGSAGDEDAARTGFDTRRDVPAQGFEVDVTGVGEGGDGEEGDAFEHG
ncbi:hypothetical protein ACVW19_006597 [Streptomyces sp. TE5632]